MSIAIAAAALTVGSLIPDAKLLAPDGTATSFAGKRGRYIALLVGIESSSEEDARLIEGAILANADRMRLKPEGSYEDDEKGLELVCAFVEPPERLNELSQKLAARFSSLDREKPRETPQPPPLGPMVFSVEETFLEKIGARDPGAPKRTAYLLNPRGRVVRTWEGPSPDSFGGQLANWLSGSQLPAGSRATDPRPFLKISEGMPTQLEKGLLVLFMDTRGPVDALYVGRIKAVAARCREAGLSVLGLFPAYDESAGSVAAFAKSSGFDFPCALDPGAVFADAYRATVTPEVFLLDASLSVTYAGAIDSSTWERDENRKYLLEAITTLASGGKPTVARTLPFGTGIRRSAEAASSPLPLEGGGQGWGAFPR